MTGRVQRTHAGPAARTGYEAVWFYQRLSLACAKHGRNITVGS